MLIYNHDNLYNRYVQEQANDLFLEKSISVESYKNILAKYTSRLYTPNYFIRIALGASTVVSIIFSCLLIGLGSGAVGQGGIIILLFVFAVANYVALELVVKEKRYYNAGVDNLLMFFAAAFLLSAFLVKDYAHQDLIVTGVAILVGLFLSIRFADAFMSILTYLALFVFVFLLASKFGTVAKAITPFLMMLLSITVYLLVKRLTQNERIFFYQFCCNCVMVSALITFYASGNYFIVKELSNEMFDLHLRLHDPIPFRWLFWLFTFLIPLAYIVYGIGKKDMMLIRTGLVFVAVTIFTFRYYYNVVPAEIAMLISGALLIVVSYAFIRYLKSARHGFSFDKKLSSKERIDLKALIIAEVTGKKVSADKGVEFGGGNFGGGGAGSNY